MGGREGAEWRGIKGVGNRTTVIAESIKHMKKVNLVTAYITKWRPHKATTQRNSKSFR